MEAVRNCVPFVLHIGQTSISILQVMESWAGPGNEASMPVHEGQTVHSFLLPPYLHTRGEGMGVRP